MMKLKDLWLKHPTIVPIVLLIILISCSHQPNKTSNENTVGQHVTGPPTIFYKTKSDYSNFVFVQLDENREEIISFPAPSDIRGNMKINEPIALENGFLLDQRGIYPNSAFLDITFEDYSKLSSTPSNEQLKALILDNDPFISMYRCNIRKEDELVSKLNELIRNNNFDNCTRLK
jgi:hypothetical protein